MSYKSGIAPLKNAEGSLAPTDSEIGEKILNRSFVSVSTVDIDIIPTNCDTFYGATLNIIYIFSIRVHAQT